MRSTLLLLGVTTASCVRKVAVVGAGWGGLSCAHHLSKCSDIEVTLIDAAPRVGGLIRDGFTTPAGRKAEAGQHGFWAEYHNIFALVDELGLNADDIFTQYAEQGQYSPNGLEAVWPIFRDQPQLPTGLAQGLYTKFLNLPPTDLITAAPLVAAFSELDFNDEKIMARYDRITFRDLCAKLGVSTRLYEEAFEPMILTGLFAPGMQVSAAAAMGMAYFFVLKSQGAFDVRWAKKNVGEAIFDPWVAQMAERGVELRAGARVAELVPAASGKAIEEIVLSDGSRLEVDEVVLAVGVAALRGIAANSPSLAATKEFGGFTRLRGTDCLALRLWFDTPVTLPYSANPAWGFDEQVGMTFFDLREIQSPTFDSEPGAVIEIDFYHASTLLALTDDALVQKAHQHLKKVLPAFTSAAVIDSAVVRLPNSVTWFAPGSYPLLPSTTSTAFENVKYAGDFVRSTHGSWSQEKAYVTGIEAANACAGREVATAIPLQPDEPHVDLGKKAAKAARDALGPFAPTIPGLL